MVDQESWSIEQTLTNLSAGRTSSQELVERCLAAIDDESGEGTRTFLKVDRDEALIQAKAIDQLRSARAHLPQFAGVPISVKDLFDVEGEPTPAGSKILQDAAPAPSDAPAITRLRAAGFIIIGRTNMTEFAYSGVGLNPHFGTPKNPYDRSTGRISGGSSSGAAISVTDKMALAGIGTDTGGSCRIPAALTGIVGFKPTAARIPMAGTIPLSPSLDSIGPLAQTITSCAWLDAVMAGDPLGQPDPVRLDTSRFAVPQSLVLDEIDDTVANAFDHALSKLNSQGASIVEIELAELLELPAINAKGGFAAAESYAWHQELLERHEAEYDPRVVTRILQGKTQSAADYIRLSQARIDLQARITRATAGFDALIMPTVSTIAPAISDLDDDEYYMRINKLMLRNPSVANFLDRCAISIPCHKKGNAPIGLMLVGNVYKDKELFGIARSVEIALSPCDVKI